MNTGTASIVERRFCLRSIDDSNLYFVPDSGYEFFCSSNSLFLLLVEISLYARKIPDLFTFICKYESLASLSLPIKSRLPSLAAYHQPVRRTGDSIEGKRTGQPVQLVYNVCMLSGLYRSI